MRRRWYRLMMRFYRWQRDRHQALADRAQQAVRVYAWLDGDLDDTHSA